MSFFDMPLEHTTFDNIIKVTYNEFYTELSINLKSNTDVGINPVKLANDESSLDKLLFKVNYSDQVHQLGINHHIRSRLAEMMIAGNFYKSSNLEINRIEAGLTFKEILPVLSNIRKELGENLFGVILVKEGSGRTTPNSNFNPFNPLVATALKEKMDRKENVAMLKYKYNIIIYTLRDSERVREMRKRIPHGNYKKDITNIMISSHLSQHTTTIYGAARRENITTMSFDVEHRDASGRIIGSNGDNYFLVPVQIANSRGLMYPSYGTVLFKNRTVKNLSPFYSANVGSPRSNDDAWGNVCTGSLNSSTDKGKMSLNHSNNTSPLNRNNIGKGAIAYAHACIDMSLQLLTGEDITKPIEPARVSLADYRKTNPNSTIAEYIEHIRKQNEKEMPTW